MSRPGFAARSASAVVSKLRPVPARDGKWDPLLFCVAGLILTSVGRLHLLLPGLAPLRPVLLLGMLGGALLVLDATPARSLRQSRMPSSLLLMGFFAWMALSVPFALRQHNSFVFLFDNFLKTVILYGLVVISVRGLRDVERLAWVYFLSGALYSAVVLARYQVDAESWRYEDLATYDPNDFAVFAVSAIPIGLVAVTGTRPGLRRLLTLAGVAVIGVAFVWAGSRGGFLALAAVVAYLVFRYRTIPTRWRILASGLIAAVVLVTASNVFWTRMETLLRPEEDYNVTSETGRLEVWKRGLGYMARFPVFGVGADNFPAAEGVLSPLAERAQYGRGVKWSAPHNSFLQIGAELGFPGLLLFMLFLASIFGALRRVERHERSEDEPASRLAQGLRASLIGFLVGAFFLSLAYSEMLYTLGAISAGLAKACGAHPLPRKQRTDLRPSRAAIGSLAGRRVRT